MRFSLRVVPNAKVQNVERFENGLKVRVRAKAQGGKANAEIIEALARHFGVPERNVRIVSGAASNKKTVDVEGIRSLP